ncbi:MAG TPA: guanylate kinase [Acidobacteriota bacterium]|nr:guanylate kinase [Acidobacteriota bacterium]
MSSRGSLIVISAPSGSGKSTLVRGLFEKLLETPGLVFSVSHTTRKPRAGEVHGKDYYFVSEKEFRELLEADRFLEYAEVYGNWYGTSRLEVQSHLEAGRDVLLDIDVQGAMSVKGAMPEAILIFVLPPSFEVLHERLLNRGLDAPEVIEKRLRIAREEVGFYCKYDYIIINQDIEQSLFELKSIISAARCMVSRRREQAEAILKTFIGKENE